MRRYLSLGVKFVFVLSIFITGCLVFIELTTEKAVQKILSENIEVIHREVSNSTYDDVDNFVQEAETFIQSWRKSKMMSSFLIGMSFLEIDLMDVMEANPWIARIEVVSEDGSEVSYPNPEGGEVTGLSKSLWYQQTKAKQEIVWQPAIGKSDYFRISAPLYSTYGDNFAGVCSILIKASVFEDILVQHGVAGGSILLVNQTGAVLATDQPTQVDQELFDQHEFFQQAFASEEEIFGHFDYANDTRITFIKQIPKLRSVLLLQVPKGVAYSDVTALTKKLRGLGIFTLIGIIILTAMISRVWLTRRIEILVKSADSIASGHLNESIQLKSNDELGKLATAFNTMAANLRTLIQDILTNSKEVAEASTRIDKAAGISNQISEQVAGSIQQVATGAENQTHYIEGVNSQLFDFSHFIEGLTTSSQELQDTAYSTREKADKGSDSMRKVAEQMEQIHQNITESSQVIFNMTNMTDEISNFVNIIDNIANQTNLLALNAAIEAARAGEEGRGFAVVAGEIRTLSEEVSTSAGKIRELVDRTQEFSKQAAQVMEAGVQQIERGQNIVHENGTIYTDIHNSVEETLQAIDLVNQMIGNLSENTTQIVADADRISSIAQENAASAEEVAASTEEQTAAMIEIARLTESLKELSYHLNQMVEKFEI